MKSIKYVGLYEIKENFKCLGQSNCTTYCSAINSQKHIIMECIKQGNIELDDTISISYMIINDERVLVCVSDISTIEVSIFLKKMTFFIDKLDTDVDSLIRNGLINSKFDAYSQMLESYLKSELQKSTTSIFSVDYENHQQIKFPPKKIKLIKANSVREELSKPLIRDIESESTRSNCKRLLKCLFAAFIIVILVWVGYNFFSRVSFPQLQSKKL